MKRKIVGGLLVGLPTLIFLALLYLTGAWIGLAIVLAGLGVVFLMAFAVIRGLELIFGDLL